MQGRPSVEAEGGRAAAMHNALHVDEAWAADTDDLGFDCDPGQARSGRRAPGPAVETGE